MINVSNVRLSTIVLSTKNLHLISNFYSTTETTLVLTMTRLWSTSLEDGGRTKRTSCPAKYVIVKLAGGL